MTVTHGDWVAYFDAVEGAALAILGAVGGDAAALPAWPHLDPPPGPLPPSLRSRLTRVDRAVHEATEATRARRDEVGAQLRDLDTPGARARTPEGAGMLGRTLDVLG